MGKIYLAQIILLAWSFGANGQTEAEARALRFETAEIQLGSFKIKVEVADTPERHTIGLMYRKQMDANAGMLFVFSGVSPHTFWMKNTLIPLSIGFFDGQGKLLNTHEMKPSSLMQGKFEQYPSAGPARFALEMNKGWFARNNIKPGAQMKLVSPGRSTLLKSVFAAIKTGP